MMAEIGNRMGNLCKVLISQKKDLESLYDYNYNYQQTIEYEKRKWEVQNGMYIISYGKPYRVIKGYKKLSTLNQYTAVVDVMGERYSIVYNNVDAICEYDKDSEFIDNFPELFI